MAMDVPQQSRPSLFLRVLPFLLAAALIAFFRPEAGAASRRDRDRKNKREERQRDRKKKNQDQDETPEASAEPEETPDASGEPEENPRDRKKRRQDEPEESPDPPPPPSPSPTPEPPPPAYEPEPLTPPAPAPEGSTRARLGPVKLVYAVDFDEISKRDGEMEGAPQCAAFSPNGRWLAVGGKTKVTRFFDAVTGQFIIQQPSRHLPIGGHRAVAWTEDSRYCFATGSDHCIWLWDSGRNFACYMAIRGGIPNETIDIDYNPRRRMLLSGGSTGSLQVWDVFGRGPAGGPRGVMGIGDRSSGPAIAAHGISEAANGQHSKNVLDVSWDPDGSRFASGSYRGLHIWDARTWGPQHQPFKGTMSRNWWSNVSKDKRSIPTYDLRLLHEVPATEEAAENGEAVHRVAWSPDGRRLAVGLGVGKALAHSHRFDRQQMPIIIYNTENWQVERRWNGHPRRVYALEWSPDGSVLASGGLDGAKFWDPESGRLLLSITDARDEISGVAWSSSGEWVAICPGNERHDSPGPSFKHPGNDHLCRVYTIVSNPAPTPAGR